MKYNRLLKYSFACLVAVLFGGFAVAAIHSEGSEEIVFQDSFSDLEDASDGGNGVFTGNVAGSKLTEREGWSVLTNAYIGQGCLRLGTAKNDGVITTNTLELTGDATLTFEAAGWGSGTNVMNVSAEGAEASGSWTLENAGYNTYSVAITNATGNVTVSISGKRAFIKNVKIVKAAGEESSSWRDIKADLTSTALIPEGAAQWDDVSTGIAVAEDGTLSRVDKEGAAIVFNGKWHGTQYGWAAFTATVQVQGCVKITYGSSNYGSEVVVTDTNGEQVAKLSNKAGNTWSPNAPDQVTVAYYRTNAPTTLSFSKCDYVGYFAVEAIDEADLPAEVTEYTVTFAQENAEGVAPAAKTVEAGATVKIPANTTLFVEGKTLTCWTDGDGNQYNFGDEVAVNSDLTLTPVFTDNAVDFADRTAETTLVWQFGESNGAGTLNAQGKSTILVTQATIGENVIDVKMDIDATSGKINNVGRGDEWAQCNDGTKLIIPAYKGMKVTFRSYGDAVGTTLGGEEVADKSAVYNGTAATVDLVAKGISYISNVVAVYPVPTGGPDIPVAQDVTGTWDYSNAEVMDATYAIYENGAESGEVEAIEKNGLMMIVEPNGASFRKNGNNIQVATGAVFKIPVKNAGDLVTVKGYPGYSKYTIGNSTEVLTNENSYKAKISDAENGYVAVTSADGNNYYLAISVVQYAPKEKVTLDNEPATATFPFDQGTEGQTATFSNADYFLNSKVAHGSDVVLEGKDNKGLNQTWFNPLAKDGKADEGNAICFLITPKPGFSFTPTNVSFKSTRFGTNGGKLDIAWQNVDGTTVSLASGVQPNRDNGDPNVSEFTYSVSGATAAESTCGLVINLYSLDPGKHVGFGNIVIEGTLSGSEKDVPILASFKVNGNEYTVEDVFGDQYEATLELPKAEPMVSSENPLTDVIASSGEVGTLVYEGTETSCKVTIPMTAGDTQMEYVLNVVFKPDFTLSYMDVDGTTVLATQIVEKDATIGQFVYDIEDVASSKDGFKARGWFKQNYLGAKFTTADVITGDTQLFAIETEIEYPSDSRKYVYDLTNKFFYDEDHEGFNSIGTGYWHDVQHGWVFNNGDQIELLVGKKATINFSLCRYSNVNATIEGSNGASIDAVVDSDGGAGSFDYEGEEGILTLTIHSEGAVYIHSITVFNTTTTNYTKQGEWLIVKQGDASSLLDAIEVAKGVENAKIFLPDGTYDLGETVKTIISGKNVSLIGQSAENTIIVNRPPVAMEGLDKADLLKNTGEGLYMQDISLKNDLSYGGNDGRAASLHDTGTKTICKNVFLLSHQDTYYSHKVGGLYYFEGGELHGTVDYLCGNGKAYYNEVKLVNEVRGSATITANSELYVFNNCTVENNANTYNFGRAWSDNPVCVYLNTTLLDPDRLVSTRWNLNGLNCDYSIAGEYGTKDANGNDITPESNVVTFTKQNTTMNTILDASALTTYSMENVLGEWAATAKESTKQLDAPVASYKNGVVTWVPANDGAIAYALFKNGEFVGITEGTTFDVEVVKGDELTIRTANARGGFGPAAAVTITTGIEEMVNEAAQPTTIYNINGVRVKNAQKGIYIINGKKVVK